MSDTTSLPHQENSVTSSFRWFPAGLSQVNGGMAVNIG